MKLFYPSAFLQVVLCAVSGEGDDKNRAHLNQSLELTAIADVRVNAFKHVHLLEKAIEVNLEEIIGSPSFDSNSCPEFQKVIYNAYKNHAGKKGEWGSTFKKSLEDWKLFGVHKHQAVALSLIGLLRVFKASKYKLSTSHTSSLPHSGTGMKNRLNNIFNEVCKKSENQTSTKTFKLSTNKIYQTLLWFYGTYKDDADEDELRAIKLECPMENQLEKPTRKKRKLTNTNTLPDCSPEERNFEVVKYLIEALNVNLEEKFNSEDFNFETLPDYEKDIHRFYKKAKGKWAVVLKNTIKYWHLFGNLKCKVEQLAFYGLARICEASRFNLDPDVIPKIKGDSSGMKRTNRIFYEIAKENRQLNADQIYQTLLGFYGRFYYYSSLQELDGVKMQSTVEKLVQSGQNLNTSTQQSLAIIPTMEATETDGSKVFKYAHLLQEALEVNLEDLIRSTFIHSNSCPEFLEEIYDAHKISVSINKSWANTFKRTLKVWNLFELQEPKTESLSFLSLLRVLDASNFKLSSSLTTTFPLCGNAMTCRMNSIINEVCNNNKLSSQEIYQTLLWFYGRFKDEATEDEIRAIKVECSTEKLLNRAEDASTKVTATDTSNNNTSFSTSSVYQCSQSSDGDMNIDEFPESPVLTFDFLDEKLTGKSFRVSNPLPFWRRHVPTVSLEAARNIPSDQLLTSHTPSSPSSSKLKRLCKLSYCKRR